MTRSITRLMEQNASHAAEEAQHGVPFQAAEEAHGTTEKVPIQAAEEAQAQPTCQVARAATDKDAELASMVRKLNDSCFEMSIVHQQVLRNTRGAGTSTEGNRGPGTSTEGNRTSTD
ncbi:hypothetical protein V6N12_021227 [Hibiscus sabdariffa]|uniref:Uncharacterized protein n=1 Tax=Hibiscus sabdariffa TaxID=183260 RepID=A0ABR2FR27_9ROSI